MTKTSLKMQISGVVREQTAKVFELIKGARGNEAVKIARGLHEKWPADPDASFILGYALAANRETEALIHLTAAYTARPNNIEFMVRYGVHLLEIGDLPTAEPVLLKALELDPKQLIALWALGNFYVSISRMDKAQSYFDRALELPSPDEFRQTIELQRIKGMAQLGDIEKAKLELRAILASRSPRVDELAYLVQICDGKISAQETKWLDNELLGGNLPPKWRAKLMNLKANILDKSGQFDDALKLLLESKSLHSNEFDMRAFVDQVEQNIRIFDAQAMRDLDKPLDGSDFEPIYIVGMPRSGTTLTQQILSNHSMIAGAGELGEISIVEATIRGVCGYDEDKLLIDKIREADLNTHRVWIEKLMRYLGQNKVHVIDKMPQNFRYVHLIKLLFPKAKIIHCFRNPADNFLSAFQYDMNGQHSYTYDPDLYVEYYQLYWRLMAHWKEVFSKSIYSLEYELLVSEPRATVAKLLAFLGLDWQENCLSPHKSTSRAATPSFVQVRSSINQKSVGRWKTYEKYLARLDHELAGLSMRGKTQG